MSNSLLLQTGTQHFRTTVWVDKFISHQSQSKMARKGPAYTGLAREREATITSINQALGDACNNGHDWPIVMLDVKMSLLEGYWQRFQSAQRQLLVEYADVDVIQENMDEVEATTSNTYAAAKAEMFRLKKAIHDAQPNMRSLKASEIHLSKFNGQYTQWAGWRSEFQAKVLNTKLDVADKIGLLLGALTNEAANCAGRAESLDQIELDRIWRKLEKTYDNKYQQVYAHIMQINNIAPMQTASAERLREMIDTTDEHLRMLKRFGIDTDAWSAMVCVTLLGKLDSRTRHQWEVRPDLPAMPELNALCEFLESRINAIRNIEQSNQQQRQASNQPVSTEKPNGLSKDKATNASKNRHHPYNRQQGTVDNTKGNQKSQPPVPECPTCGANVHHHLWHCDKFRALSVNEQVANLEKWGICPVCLVAKHKAAECTKGICPICKTGKHNSLICPQKTEKKVHHARQQKRQRRGARGE